MHDAAEIMAWAAAAFTLVSFTRKTMIPLRWYAATANLCYVLYGIFGMSYAVLVLHAAQLPINLWRVRQMKLLIADISRAATQGEISPSWLMPYGSRMEKKPGDVLMRRGEKANHLFYLLAGTVRLEEIGETRGAGQVFGELAMFSPDAVRTQTVVCETDCVVLGITEFNLKQLYFQNPQFGFYLAKLINTRLSADVKRLQAELEQLRKG